ncbi:MAG: protease inhibitor I42 family protein [Negativicutes bacterium]|jgi:predicted secreted protein
MKKVFLISLLLIALFGYSVANATDGYYPVDRAGDPADSSSAYGNGSTTDSNFSFPIKRLEIAIADTGVTFSSKSVLLVVGQTLNIKAFGGFGSSYTFGGDSNFNSLFTQDGLSKTYIFSGVAAKAGLAEAQITQKGTVADRLGIQVIAPYVVDENANKQTISMPQYTWLMVKLKSNPTTGYDWQVVSQGDNVNIADSGYMINNNAVANKLSGAPSKKYYLIQAVAAGTAKFALQYYQPWDASTVAGNYELTIEVVAGA